MSHLHLPDGVLPVWFWVGCLVVTLGFVMLALRRLEANRRLLPAVAVISAVVLVALNIPLGLPLHLNLAAFAGIVLGPILGFLAVFVVNMFSALVGHGGLSVLGVNTLLVGSEALIAGSLFIMLGGATRLLRNATLSVVVALLVSTVLVAGIAGIAGMQLEAMVLDNSHGYYPVTSDEIQGFLGTFLKLVAPLVVIWLVLELSLTLLVVRYVNKVKGGWFVRG